MVTSAILPHLGPKERDAPGPTTREGPTPALLWTGKVSGGPPTAECPGPISRALMAHAMEVDREGCLKAEMDDYLSKLFKPVEIDAILGKWLTSPSGDGQEKREGVPPLPDDGVSV